MKNYFKKVIKLFTDRKIWVRQTLVSTVSASVAWQLGDLAFKSGGLVAAIVSTLTVRISLYKSVREGLAQVIGTAFGALVAFLSLTLFHLGFIVVFATVVFSFVFARALRMSESAAVNVPITALIVIGPGLSESNAYHRLLSTIIGAAVAVPFSYFSHPSTPEGRTVEKINRIAKKCSKLLGEIAEGVVSNFTPENFGESLAQARVLMEEVPDLRAQAQEARGYARWIPKNHIDVAETLQRKSIAVEHIAVQVRTIARTLFDIAVDGSLPDSIIRPVGVALSAASYAVEVKMNATKSNEKFTYSAIADLRQAALDLSESLVSQKDLANQIQIIRAISLITNLERIADSLDESSPAITEVDTPSQPGDEAILTLLPVEGSVRWTRKLINKVKKLFS